ncbi:UDP-N-acetylglucosamine--undecaprenyl-phosphate N-acetylglucosaminephosphotransferase [Pseudoalteromonas lipolytica]|jgi:UDP-GlcNAc:undecaprenyl-phosphate GlcNAc-1-phosphate transferase
MIDFFLPLLVSFTISFFAIKMANPIAIRVGLVDSPCSRKVHQGHVPLVGGIAIYLSTLICSMLFIEGSRDLNLYLIAAALVLFLGAIDDRYHLSVRVRLVAQVLVASLMIFGTEIYLQDLGEIIPGQEISLGVFGILFTIVAIIAGINAINMIDGMDGLAGCLSLVAFTAVAYLLSGLTTNWFLLPIVFISALLAYLVFNLTLHASLKKVFMGDSGNMLIGLSLVWLMVLSSEQAEPALRPVTALYILAIPIMDMACVIIRRIMLKQSPFTADRQHIHHLFEELGYSKKFTLIVISVTASILAILGCLAEYLQVPDWQMLTFYLFMFFCYTKFRIAAWKKVKQNSN